MGRRSHSRCDQRDCRRRRRRIRRRLADPPGLTAKGPTTTCAASARCISAAQVSFRRSTRSQRRGLVELRRDYVPYLEQPYAGRFSRLRPRAEPLDGRDGHPARAAAARTSAENADRLETLIRANAHDERREVMWGSPGTMLAAGALARPDRRRALARALARERHVAARCSGIRRPTLWTQHLYGHVDQHHRPGARVRGLRARARLATPTTSCTDAPPQRCDGTPSRRTGLRTGRRPVAGRRSRQRARPDPRAVVPRRPGHRRVACAGSRPATTSTSGCWSRAVS